MIRVSHRDRAGLQRSDGWSPGIAWSRRTDIPLGMVLAWLAALVVTTEGLMTFQSLYG